jgi:hypothetical protein
MKRISAVDPFALLAERSADKPNPMPPSASAPDQVPAQPPTQLIEYARYNRPGGP